MSDSDNPFDQSNLEQRFVQGKLIRIGTGALHFELNLPDFPRIKQARVDSEDLGSTVTEFTADHPDAKGKTFDLFLIKPTRVDPTLWHASLMMGRKETNPWIKKTLAEGEIVTGTVVRYVANFGAIVKADGDPRPFLIHRNELPSPSGKSGKSAVQELLHIGDRVKGRIVRFDYEKLNIELDVRGLWEAEDVEDYQSDSDATRTTADKEEQTEDEKRDERTAEETLAWAGKKVLIVDDDPIFTDDLQRILTRCGMVAETLKKLRPESAEAYFKEKGSVDFAVLDYHFQEEGTGFRDGLLALLQRNKTKTLIVSGHHQEAESFAQERQLYFLPKPFSLGELFESFHATNQGTYRPRTIQPTGEPSFGQAFWHEQQQWIERDSSSLLKELCEDKDVKCLGAAWVVQVRKGVYEIRHQWKLKSDYKNIETNLAQTMVHGLVETGKEDAIVSEIEDTGKIQDIAPQGTRYVYGFTVKNEDADKDSYLRAFLFFRDKKFDDQAIAKLRFSKLALKEAITKIHFQRYLEHVLPFIVSGSVNAGLLHELRNFSTHLVNLADEETSSEKDLVRFKRKFKDRMKAFQRLLKEKLVPIQQEKSPILAVDDTIQKLVGLIKYDAKEQLKKLKAPGSSKVKEERLIHFKGKLGKIKTCLDPMVLEQSLVNLVQNAMYHCRHRNFPKVRIESKLSPDRKEIWIDVQDNGLGVNAEQKTNLFTPRSSGTSKNGTGMGLYVSRDLLRTVGGDLELVESYVYHGSIFRIKLPVIIGEKDNER